MADLKVESCFTAAVEGKLALMQDLVNKGANPSLGDYDMRTALHLAASEGHYELCRYLVLDRKVDVNPLDRWGNTPLADAIRNKYWDCASFLRKEGGVVANINIEDLAAVVHAAAKGDEAAVKELLEKGHDVNATDLDGRTALHCAAKSGSVSLINTLLAAGAEVNVVDRKGHTALVDAMEAKQDAAADLLRSKGALTGDADSFIKSSAFEATIARVLNLVRARSHVSYVAAWIQSADKQSMVVDTNWSTPDADIVKVAAYRQASEAVHLKLGDASDKSAILEAIRTKQPVWIEDIAAKMDSEPAALREQCAKVGFRAVLAVPVFFNDSLVFVVELRSFEALPKNQNTITDVELTSGRMVASAVPLGNETRNVWKEQSDAVFRMIQAENKFADSVIMKEINWFYNHLGLDDFYFRTIQPAQIARHILAFIAAKLHAHATGTEANIEFILEEADSALYICPVDRVVEIERMIETKYLAEGFTYEGGVRKQRDQAISVKFFVSKGTAASDSNTKLAIFIVESHPWLHGKCAEHEADIWKIASALFLREKSFASRARYARLVERASRSLGPVISVDAPQKSGEDAIISIAYQAGSTHSFMSSFTHLLKRMNITIVRHYIESFCNGIVVHSIHLLGRKLSEMDDLAEQASLLWILPRTTLTRLVEESVLTLAEAIYAYSAWKFAFHFSSAKSDEFAFLWKALADNDDGRANLMRLKKRMRADIATELRIADTIFEQTALIKELFQDFRRFHAPGTTDKPQFNQELWVKIQKQVLNPVDLEVMRCFLVFNGSLRRTNFFYKSKTAISFRFDPTFLADEYPVVPYAVYMILSAEARGFHVRFDDVARGGIRLIKSRNKQLWQRNAETVFDENYNLAWTQQKKNKDIPEGGSKGTVLLNIDHQDKASVAFHKYIDAMLDCLLPRLDEMRDHYGKDEIIFCGPDENTAELMDWAALYSKERGYSYWSAFTTGKSVELGGIPHDLYGMTTRGVHQYVLGVLSKLGLKEEEMRKGQTGGPDGDLGSNEIKISKDKTIFVVDGSGVLYDPEGIDRTELLRLATARVMTEKFDRTKLSSKGFFVHIDDKDVRLPNGDLVESGMTFRNNFHLNKLGSCELFVPCGGRPEAVNVANVDQLIVDGKPIYKYIVEGANLFFTQEARLKLEKAGAVVIKDASANKGGVTSSSLEVLSALALNTTEFKEHMCVENGHTPAFYKSYVEDTQNKIAANAQAEFECLWRESQATGMLRSILTDRLSERINELNHQIRKSGIFANESLRRKVLLEVLPPTLLKLLSLDTIISRLPESYIVSTLSAHLASRYVYEAGLSPNEFKFYQFMQRYL